MAKLIILSVRNSLFMAKLIILSVKNSLFMAKLIILSVKNLHYLWQSWLFIKDFIRELIILLVENTILFIPEWLCIWWIYQRVDSFIGIKYVVRELILCTWILIRELIVCSQVEYLWNSHYPSEIWLFARIQFSFCELSLRSRQMVAIFVISPENSHCSRMRSVVATVAGLSYLMSVMVQVDEVCLHSCMLVMSKIHEKKNTVSF